MYALFIKGRVIILKGKKEVVNNGSTKRYVAVPDRKLRVYI
jgi:hypothetical protein